ncbi:hypothetical protein L1281_002589 [Neisseria sp. HSC-16F19]|nr:hypothetical protein [Neisseria sp. HSC-16F19]MCP2041971.1 hypothetical protein [Neisseria sp. HSC-16F19]
MGDPQKARRYLDGQRAGEAQGTEQGLKDLANLPMAYIESIAADAALMKESYGLLPLYAVNKSLAAAEGTRGIYISVQEWQEAYKHALKHDPYTAGLMKGMMDAQIGVHAGAMVVPTGSLVQAGKLSKLGVYLQRAAKTPDAGGARTSLPRNPSPVDGEMAGGNKPIRQTAYADIIRKGDVMPIHSSVSIREKSNIPTIGKPNSSMDLLNENGSVKRRRYYGADGKAIEDIDFNHQPGRHTFPHRHTWTWKDNVPSRSKE